MTCLNVELFWATFFLSGLLACIFGCEFISLFSGFFHRSTSFSPRKPDKAREPKNSIYIYAGERKRQKKTEKIARRYF